MQVSAAGSGTSRMPWVSVVAALFVPLVVTAVAHVLDPEAERQARVDALVEDVDALRGALVRQAAAGPVGSCGSEDAARTAIEAHDAGWHAAPCWSILDASPTTLHAMWIVNGGDDFAVHGIADIDGDGELIEVVATREHAAERWTAPGVL